MSDGLKSVLLIVAFTLIGGFFVGAETALVALRQSQAERLGEKAGKRGRRLLDLINDPNRFLAAVQVGITVASFLAAGYGAAEIAPQVVPWLVDLGLSESLAGTVAFVGVTLVIVYFTLVIGELVPKRLALRRVEGFSLAVAGPIDIISTLFRPFIWLLSVSTNAVMRVMGIRDSNARQGISGEELRGIVAMHQELSQEERELIDDVFEAGDRELREVMIPRTDVEFLDGSMSVHKAGEVVLSLPHTRYPVIRGSNDNVIGFVHLRDVIGHKVAHPDRFPLSAIARDIAVYPGTKRVIPTLTEMRRDGHHLALVLDEYGGTAGIVTLEDLVEEVVGDIRDEYDIEEVARPNVGEGIELDGLTNIEDFEEESGVVLPEGPYETVAGFLIERTGQLASLDMVVEIDGHRVSVVEVEGRRISRVRVEALDQPENAAAEGHPDEGPSTD